jgi:acyl-coenzyme A thioesterase PaaI-like protein
MNPKYLKLLINVYPPYWGTGITVKSISQDYREVWVQMKMRWYNRNYVETHFGGSLYAMTDPFCMVMLIHILGKEFVVWDRSAHIDFIKPSQGTVTARFLITEEQIKNIMRYTSDGQKYLPEFSVNIEDEGGETVARVVKTLYIRKKAKNGAPQAKPVGPP